MKSVDQHFHTLKRHMRTHTEEKPFSCFNIFRQFLIEKTHANTHEIKTFPCEVCGSTFSRNYFLKGHMSMLTGEKSLISISQKFKFENPHCRKTIFLNCVDQQLQENHFLWKFIDRQFLLRHIEAKPFILEFCKTA